MSLFVIFSLAAHRKLRQRTVREAATNPSALTDAMTDIRDKLREVFPRGDAVVVQDVYTGFRPRPGQHILLVELTGSDPDDGLYVVKFDTNSANLARELKGWNDCRPRGLRHDIVLMGLEPRYRGEGNNRELYALVYTDAEQLIGVDQTLSLETALLDATRLGVPSPESVADVLFDLYERLGLLLYRNSYDDDPTREGYRFRPESLDHRLVENIRGWEANAGAAFETRAGATTAVHGSGLDDHFRDPAALFGQMLAQIADGTVRPAECVPRLLRGYSHGDLHARNVLVGRVGDRVLWPAVYDYGDMGTDNLIGWDFVKMETEFKIRAYPDLFPGRQLELAREIIRFEAELFEETEECRRSQRWPKEPRPGHRGRLAWLILTIRRLAGNHLGLYRNRSSCWLAEVYFLLAVYGLNAVRFDNLTEVQRLGAFLAAGCAAARYVWDRPPDSDS